MDEDQNSEQVEITTQDQGSTIVDEYAQEQVLEDPSGQEEDTQDRNWRELRRKADEAEKNNKTLEERNKMQDDFIKSLLAQSQQPQKQREAPPPEVDEFADISQEEYPTFGQARKLVQKDARTVAREEFMRLEREREESRFHERLKSKYSDFDDVVNTETIANFEKKEPELARTIADLKDPYKMGFQTYNFIKSMGLSASSSDKRHAKEVENKIEKNEKSVTSPQAYNKRPMAQAFTMANMSDTEKATMYEEMMGFANKSSGY